VPWRLEQAVEALEAGIAVRGCPALQDAVAVGLDGGKRLPDRVEDRAWIEQVRGVAQEIGEPTVCPFQDGPAQRLGQLVLFGFDPANPAAILDCHCARRRERRRSGREDGRWPVEPEDDTGNRCSIKWAS